MSQDTQIHIRDTILDAWDLVLDNTWRLVILTLYLALRAVGLTALILCCTVHHPISLALFAAILIGVALSNGLHIFKASLSMARGQPVVCFPKPDLKKLFNWVIACAIFLPCLFLGSFLLLLPGLIVYVFGSFIGFAIADGETAIEAIRTSIKIARQHFWQIVATYAIFALLVLSTMLINLGFESVIQLTLFATFAKIYVSFFLSHREQSDV